MTASESDPTGPVDGTWAWWVEPDDPRTSRPDRKRRRADPFGMSQSPYLAAAPVPDGLPRRPLEDLLNSTALGDREAFAEIYRRLSPRVFRSVVGSVPAQAAADAIVVDVFVQVWRTAASYDPGTGPGTLWVMTITRQRTLHHLRRAVHAAHHRADDIG